MVSCTAAALNGCFVVAVRRQHQRGEITACVGNDYAKSTSQTRVKHMSETRFHGARVRESTGL
ncbi:hypothetical protein, partial [Escherichia coli]|uniref:hypothetical protein n=1 Tax=Escherichia coli TaxID=562 RepID=UPI0021B36538